MLIIDAHEDIAYNALEWGRDIRHSVHTIRAREAREGANCCEDERDIAMSGLPELRQAGVAIVCGVIFAFPHGDGTMQNKHYTQAYRDAQEAYRVGQEQLAYYKTLAQETGISLLGTREDMQRVLAAWAQTDATDPQRPLGIVPLMEGADPIRTPDEAAQWFADGLRIVGLAWNGTRYSGGTFAPGPLTPEGRALLHAMERVGLILDTSHLAEESFWQALQHFHGPTIASHSNCRALVPGARQLSDEMIRALVERDSVIGIALFNKFLDGTWSRTNSFPISLTHMVRHIDHICQLTGNARHVGLGSDIDGGFGRDETPIELETAADLPKLADALHNAGYTADDIAQIMGGNWQRFLLHALPSVHNAHQDTF